jgi:ABC-type antimicrobial peptide transport system permease subunit
VTLVAAAVLLAFVALAAAYVPAARAARMSPVEGLRQD